MIPRYLMLSPVKKIELFEGVHKFGNGVLSVGGITREFDFNEFRVSLLALHQVRTSNSFLLVCVFSNDG